MTPGARIAAAIEVLDEILTCAAAEQALTGWGRRSRFAGSGDRRAVRDLVFDALRRRRSYAAAGGSDTGRGLMIGALRMAGIAPETRMTGEGHAPRPPTEAEAARTLLGPAERCDLPDWLYDRFRADLGDRAEGAAMALRDRAPVFVRVNAARTTLPEATALLARDGIAARPVEEMRFALEITGNAGKIASSAAYQTGLVELQDASSQAAVLALPLLAGHRVLDFCAGGGGKALAMAARMPLAITAHDALPQRMRDLPARAARGGHPIAQQSLEQLAGATFDLVLVDAPCSGSGTWRRDPEGKWRLTPEGLDDLASQQHSILSQAAAFVRRGGVLAYATCSVLRQENQELVERFGRTHRGLRLIASQAWLPGPRGDGFYLAVMQLTDDST